MLRFPQDICHKLLLINNLNERVGLNASEWKRSKLMSVRENASKVKRIAVNSDRIKGQSRF